MDTIVYSSWVTDVSGSYQVAANWNPAILPTLGPSTEFWATIGGGATSGASGFTVTSSASVTIGALTLNANATLAIAAGLFRIDSVVDSYAVAVNYGALDVAAGAIVAFGLASNPETDTSELQNIGAVNLNGGALLIAAANFGLKGGGTLTLAAGRIIGDAGGNVAALFNDDSTIAGSGYLGVGSGLGVTNARLGVIDANAAGALVLDTATHPIENAGTIETTGAGGLVIESDIGLDGQLDAEGTGALRVMDEAQVAGGGDVSVAAGSAVVLDEGVLAIDGVISVAATGKIETTTANTLGVGANNDFVGDTLDGGDIENAGAIMIANDSTLNLNASIYGAGAMDVEGSNGPTKLEIFGDGASIYETGGLLLSNSADNAIVGDGAGVALGNFTEISGAGTIGDTWLRFVNQRVGVVDANDSVGLTIVADAAAIKAASEAENDNAGTIETTGTGGLTISGGTFDNAGYLEAAGSGSLTLSDDQIDNGGGIVETLGSGSIKLGKNSNIFDQAYVSISAGGSLDTSTGDASDGLRTNVLNSGAINVVAGSTLVVDGQWRNSGSVKIEGSSAASIAIPTDDSWDLLGGGGVDLEGADSAIVSRGAGANLDNRSDAIVGSGLIGDTNMAIENDANGVIDATGSAGLTLNAMAYNASDDAAHIYNAGTLESNSAGGLTIESAMYSPGSLIANSGGDIFAEDAVYGSGAATINGTGSIEFGGADQSDVHFAAGGAGALILGQSVLFSADIWGFSVGDAIDLRDFAYNAAGTEVDAAKSGFGSAEGTLYVTNGMADSAPLYLQGDYAAAYLSLHHLAFEVTSDGHASAATGADGTMIKLAATSTT